MNTKTRTKGFSIIEVVLVLAIAGLIFLMVFVALPALQRGQRDTARKNDANTVASALGSYRSNNRGKMPSTAAEYTAFRTQYVEALSQYALDDYGTTRVSPGAGSAPISQANLTEDRMFVVIGENCKGINSSRAAAIYVKLESGNGAVVCTDA